MSIFVSQNEDQMHSHISFQVSLRWLVHHSQLWQHLVMTSCYQATQKLLWMLQTRLQSVRDLTRFVHVWLDGVELESKKHSSFVGRTSLSVNKLKHGDISLKLYKAKLSDEGTYRCFNPTLDKESSVELMVGEWINQIGILWYNIKLTVDQSNPAQSPGYNVTLFQVTYMCKV